MARDVHEEIESLHHLVQYAVGTMVLILVAWFVALMLSILFSGGSVPAGYFIPQFATPTNTEDKKAILNALSADTEVAREVKMEVLHTVGENSPENTLTHEEKLELMARLQEK